MLLIIFISFLETKMSIDCARPPDTEKLEIFPFELAAAPPGFGVNGSVGPPGKLLYLFISNLFIYLAI